MALRLRPVGGRVPVFIHLHKTGGQWTRHVLHQLGLADGEVGIEHSPISVVREHVPDAWTFGFVREPFEFLRSYCLHRHREGWHPDRDLDVECRADTFAEFLDAYLERLPGWVSRWFGRYVGGADYVGRYELLGLDLCAALRAAGFEDLDLSPVMVVAPRNVTPPVPPEVLGLGDREGEYRAAVRAAEGDAYARWYSV